LSVNSRDCRLDQPQLVLRVEGDDLVFLFDEAHRRRTEAVTKEPARNCTLTA